jgi:hypothetical protein
VAAHAQKFPGRRSVFCYLPVWLNNGALLFSEVRHLIIYIVQIVWYGYLELCHTTVLTVLILVELLLYHSHSCQIVSVLDIIFATLAPPPVSELKINNKT